MIVPKIYNATKQGMDLMDLYTYEFFENRKIFLDEEITDRTATNIITQLEYLDRHGEGDIYLYINSPGGSLTAGSAIIDAITACNNDVWTIATGKVASIATWILAVGAKKKRLATPLVEIVLHHPLDSALGWSSVVKDNDHTWTKERYTAWIKDRLNIILADNTWNRPEDVECKTGHDFYMTVEQAVGFGVIDDAIRIPLEDYIAQNKETK